MKKLMFIFAIILGISLFANKEITETDRFYEVDIEFEIPTVAIADASTFLDVRTYKIHGILVLFDPNVDAYKIRHASFVSKSGAFYYALTGTHDVNTRTGRRYSTAITSSPKSLCLVFTDKGPQLSLELFLGNTTSVMLADGTYVSFNEFGYGQPGATLHAVLDVAVEWNPLYGEWEFSEGAGKCFVTLGSINEPLSGYLRYGLDKSGRNDRNRRYAPKGFGTVKVKRSSYKKVNDIKDDLRDLFSPSK